MRLFVNGKAEDLDQEMSIAEFLSLRNVAQALVAVEHNLQWTRREQWSEIVLKENDRLEVVRIMAGGSYRVGRGSSAFRVPRFVFGRSSRRWTRAGWGKIQQ